MVDGDAREAEQMGGWCRALVHCLAQTLRHPRLVPAPNREHHAPVAPQEIGLPRAAAFGFEQWFVSVAEGAQTVIARDWDSLRRRARAAGIAQDDLPDEAPIDARLGGRLETGMVEELARRPH